MQQPGTGVQLHAVNPARCRLAAPDGCGTLQQLSPPLSQRGRDREGAAPLGSRAAPGSLGRSWSEQNRREVDHAVLILGFRFSSVLLTTLLYVCERCGNNAAHELTRRVRKFTVFFIPVFPVGGAKYLDTCTVCGRVLQVPEEQARMALTQSAPQPTRAASPGLQDSPSWGPQDG